MNKILDELKKQLPKENKAIINVDGMDIEIKIQSIKNICSIETKTKIGKTRVDKLDVIKALNEMQKPYIYKIDEKNKYFIVSSCMWIDRKPTYKALNELVEEMISNMNSIIQVLTR